MFFYVFEIKLKSVYIQYSTLYAADYTQEFAQGLLFTTPTCVQTVVLKAVIKHSEHRNQTEHENNVLALTKAFTQKTHTTHYLRIAGTLR